MLLSGRAQFGNERWQLGITLDATHASLAFQETHHRPAQRHIGILVIGYPLAVTAHHRVGRLDDVGVAQAAGQVALHTQPGHGEHLLQPFEQAGRRIRMLGLEFLGPPSSTVNDVSC